MEFKKVPEIETFDDLVKTLRQIFESDNIDVDYVQNVLLSYQSNPNEWKKFAHFDPHKYTRNLVDKGNGKYNLMLVCWQGGHGSSIHDHSDSHCFMKMLSGTLQEIRYEWPDSSKSAEERKNDNRFDDQLEEMKVLEENPMKINSVAYINDSLGLHRVENRSHTGTAVSLHLYVPPYSRCQVFDARTGQKNEAKVTFYSKYGLRTPFKVQTNDKQNEQNSDSNNNRSIKADDK